MDALDKDLYEADMREMSERFDTSQLPEGHLENHSKLYLAVKEVMAAQGYDFGTLKCWPEMGNLHTTPCAVLGRLADDGINIGCEGDVDAEIAQIAEYYLTGQPSFITDMINIDEDKNLMTFWHCGNAAPSLCNPNYDVLIRNHPLAGQGTAFYGALKMCIRDSFRFRDNRYKSRCLVQNKQDKVSARFVMSCRCFRCCCCNCYCCWCQDSVSYTHLI